MAQSATGVAAFQVIQPLLPPIPSEHNGPRHQYTKQRRETNHVVSCSFLGAISHSKHQITSTNQFDFNIPFHTFQTHHQSLQSSVSNANDPKCVRTAGRKYPTKTQVLAFTCVHFQSLQEQSHRKGKVTVLGWFQFKFFTSFYSGLVLQVLISVDFSQVTSPL